MAVNSFIVQAPLSAFKQFYQSFIFLLFTCQTARRIDLNAYDHFKSAYGHVKGRACTS
jgi:hypothetical protein